jgi:hypothetical protein
MYQEEKEGIVQNFQYNYFLKHAAATTKTDYSPPDITRPKPRLLRPLALAMRHILASLLMSRMILGTEGTSPRKHMHYSASIYATTPEK